MTSFPTGVDPAITSDPGQTLDQADHTNLHNQLSSGMHEVQALLGAKPVTTEPIKTMRQRLLDVETAVIATAPVLGTSATSLPSESQATATWNSGPKTIAFGIPRGVPGENGEDGKDGVALSGTVSNTKLTPIRAGSIVGLDISFPAPLAYIPVIVASPIQDTTGTGSPGVTTGTVSSTVVSGRWAKYKGDGAKRAMDDGATGIVYHGYYDSSFGNQRGIVCFPDLKALFPKGAVSTSVKLELTTQDAGSTAAQLTIHPNAASSPPATLPDPPSSAYYRNAPSGGLTKGAKYTFDLTSKNWGDKFIDGSYGSLVLGPERNSTGALTNSAGYGGIQAVTVKLIIAYSVTSQAPVTSIDSIPVDVGLRNITKSGFRLVVRNSNQSDESVRVNWIASQ
jgi:hypothetical protein